MATARRRNTAPQESQLDRDAREFGVGVRCGGWRLGLLVARNVEKGTAGRPKANHSPENDSGKVSMNRFAEIAGVSVSQVKYHYDAWELAAKASLVPAADKIDPGDEDIDVEADSIEVEDNPRTHWTHFYQLAKNPPEKPKKEEKKEDSKPVDEDFGIPSDDKDSDPVATESEVIEVDLSISRNELLEVLESVTALQNRLTRIGSVPEQHNDLLSQISSAALDLSTMANAMSAVNEKVEV